MSGEDLDLLLNSLHIPSDAGEYAEDLRKILLRIPPRWGRWISCDSGWYPLIVELDKKLAEIFPDYELHQVKEKFGTLRYYIGLPELKPQCCIDLEATRPCDGAVDPKWLYGVERTLDQQYALDTWFYTQFIPHSESEEHSEGRESLKPEHERRSKLSVQMADIVFEYEKRSAVTCELCGDSGQTLVRNHWHKTLCESCAKKHDYLPYPDDDYGDEDA